MKALFIIDDLRSGGAQRQLVVLAKGLKIKGFQVKVFFYFPHFYYAKELDKNGIEYQCIPSKNPLKRIYVFYRTIRKHNPDIIFTFLGIPSFISELASLPWKRWKLIVGERSANPKILRSVKSWVIRILHFIPDYVVANSFANLYMLKKVNPFISRQKLKVIYNSVDLNEYFFNPAYSYKENDVLRILVLSSYRKLKNLNGLIEAVNLLNKEIQDHILIDWYGDRSNNPDKIIEDCESLIQRYNLEHIIRLNNTCSNVGKLIQGYDAIGLISFFEGLPNSICEGMASGKVIICSSVSDLPQIINEDENGFLCNPYDIISIKNAVLKAINSSEADLRQMGANNRKKAEQLFSNEIIIGQYLELLD